MLAPEEMNRLERLRRGIYSRKTPDIIDAGRSQAAPQAQTAPNTEWKHTESNSFDSLAARIAHGASRKHSLAKKLFSISLVIFIVSVGAAAFVFLGGINMISSKNVNIQVVGPVSVGGGQEGSFDILVENQNSAELEGVKLTIMYPPGVRRADNLSEDLESDAYDLGNIKSGSNATQNIKVFLFGEKDQIKTFKVTADYKVKNSNGNFFKEKSYDVSISSSPVIVTSTYPKEINANQEINFSMQVFSNSADAPKEILLVVDYPFGFTFNSANISPTTNNNTWKISNLSEGEKRTINISGTLSGQDGEERIFKVSAGTPSTDDPRKIGVSFVSNAESILIKKPFLGLNFRVAGQTGDAVVSGSGDVQSTLKVQNNIREKIYNATIQVFLSGAAFDPQSVSPNQDGFFRSIDNTISWDKRSVEKLAELDPGQSADISWSLRPLSYDKFPKGQVPEIKIKVVVEGDRILSSGETEHISSSDNRTIKVGSALVINQKLSRTDGGMVNSGPIPPRVNQKSTYTVTWGISNTFNNVSNVTVRATLPPYVEFTGLSNPANSAVVYDSNAHQIVWNAGQLTVGTGFVSAAKTVAFQISYLPSSSQVGSQPELLGGATITGIDKTTGANVESTTGALNTRFTDSSYKNGDENVVN